MTTTSTHPGAPAAAPRTAAAAAPVGTLAARVAAWAPRAFADDPLDPSEPALVDEGLRRLALWGRALDEPHPFGADFAALVAPDVVLDRAAIERLARSVAVAPGSLDRSVLRPALALDALRAAAPHRLPALDDPYEPFIRLMERGGDLRFAQGHLVLRARGPEWILGLLDWSAYALLPPLSLDDATLAHVAGCRALSPWPRRHVGFDDPVRIHDPVANELLYVERPRPPPPTTTAQSPKSRRARRVALADRGALDVKDGLVVVAAGLAASSTSDVVRATVGADATERAGGVDVRVVALAYVFAGAHGAASDDALVVRVANLHPDAGGADVVVAATCLSSSANASSGPGRLRLVGGATNPLRIEAHLRTSATPGPRTLRARVLDVRLDVDDAQAS